MNPSHTLPADAPRDPAHAAKLKKAPIRLLKQSEIFGYATGDLGINLNFQFIGFFLAYFYTDVFGISAAHVGGLFLIARVWDGLNDPLMGIIADRTNSRWGRFRPYLLFGAVPLNLLLVACFFTPDLPPTTKVVYAYVTYFLHGMAFTAVGLPYSSISAVMTQDQQERSVISSYRMFFAVVVAMGLISIGGRPFVGLFQSEQQGFFVGALLLACCSTALLWYAFEKSKERVEVKQEKYRIREIVTILRKNDPLLILAVAMLLNTSVWVIGNSVSLYYFKYILEREDLVGIFFGIMLPGNILGALIAPMLTKRLGKRETFILGSVVVALFYAGRYWLPSDMLALFIGMSVVGTIGQMICSVTQWAMLPDTIEYGQWKTGIRSEGIPFAFFSFTQKCGMALAGSFAAFFLSISGYVANTVQTETSLNAIRLLFTVWPGVCSAVCAVILPFYRLSEKRYEAMLSELRAEADNEEGKA